MNIQTQRLEIVTRGKGLQTITREVAKFVAASEIKDGLLTLFIQHTSASLTIQENADPDVLRDLTAYFERLVPENGSYLHDTEGPDDMPAHIRTALTSVSLSIPVTEGRMALGTWQGIYVFEHRSGPQRRTVLMQLMG